jgi:hypothetical protein
MNEVLVMRPLELQQRRGLLAAMVVSVVALAGCATMNEMSADVSTFGEWPAGRAPGTYAFERLPSQQADAASQQMLEDAANAALLRAGFKPAAAGAEADVLVQVGARQGRADRSPWDDPFWWQGGFVGWRHSPWRGPGWGTAWRVEPARYDREVAVLIRDRATAKPLYEARAGNEGLSSRIGPFLEPLYRAALVDFPATGINPRRVTVPLAP